MTVKEFVEQFKMLNEENKVESIKNIINISYVPYSTKITDCVNIVNSTSYTNIDSENIFTKIFKINSPVRNMLYLLNLVKRYTEIELDYYNAAEDYDLLKESNVLELIISNIPEAEILEYTELLQVCGEDFLKNERSLIGYLDTKFETIRIILNSLLETINVETGDEDIDN